MTRLLPFILNILQINLVSLGISYKVKPFYKDIKVFLSFTNFYLQFIKSFNKIAAQLRSIVKITLPTFSPINDFSENINVNGVEVFRIKGDVRRGMSKKVKNLSKGKNIKHID